VLGEFTDYHTGDSEPGSRKGFGALLEKSPEGVVVYSIDRLSRQHPSKIMALLQYYKQSGKKVISVTEPAFNMESEFSEPLLYFITWYNNYFLTKLKRDIKSGLDKARAQGKTLGRPKIKFNRFKAHYLLFDEKKSHREVAKILGVSETSIYRFKKVWEKNPESFIKEAHVSNTDDKKTGDDEE